MNGLMQKAWLVTLLVAASKLGGSVDAEASAAQPDAAKDDQGSDIFESEAPRLQGILTDANKAVTGPSSAARCVRSSGSIACFLPNGDKFYVKDIKADGASAVAVWETDYGRRGVCRNPYGADQWAVCDYNFRENRTIRWQAWQYDGDTGRFVGDKSWPVRSRT
jgi:hypothetical protein